MSAAIDHPPPQTSFINNIELNSIGDSKIANVSIYTGRAEVTRIFKFSVKTGQNHVNVNGLPNVLDAGSVRVEGRGPATIHDVAVGTMPEPPEPEISPAQAELHEREDCVRMALERAQQMQGSIQQYLSTLHVEHVKAHELDNIMEECETTGAKLADKIRGLKKQLAAIEKKKEEQEELDDDGGSEAGKDKSLQLRSRVSLSLFAEKESDVELILIYAVLNASWTPIYDVRVDMQARETPITLVYKAAISQNTAEDWEDVPLTLETATPTYQVGIPTLSTWTLSVYRLTYKSASILPTIPQPPPMRARGAVEHGRSRDMVAMQSTSMPVRTAAVSSKGNVSATFTVPGIITIPSDGVAHNVTVTELKLDATMSWVAVPKLDTKARLSAKIKNTSEYTLLTGLSSIYVDGSFISKSNIAAVSPGETFDLALGLDPAIRVNYHPVSRKTAQTGFYSKTSVNSYLQRISIHNTKSITISHLRIVDQIPVSADESINVKLISPALPNPPRPDATVKEEKKLDGSSLNPKAKVSQGVVAEWGDGKEETTTAEEGTTIVGQDGQLSWICEIPSQGKVNLSLQWEVTSPANSNVLNL